MTTAYPAGLDAFATRANGGIINAAHVNDLGDALESVEATLGINPQGSAASVDARLDAAETSITGKADAAATTAALTAVVGTAAGLALVFGA